MIHDFAASLARSRAITDAPWWEAENGFRIVDARNNGWVTRSVAVPIEIVLGAIEHSSRVEWTP